MCEAVYSPYYHEAGVLVSALRMCVSPAEAALEFAKKLFMTQMKDKRDEKVKENVRGKCAEDSETAAVEYTGRDVE